jgi:hypothetical protein
MIDKHPAQGNWTEWVEEQYGDTFANAGGVMLHDTPPVRTSCLLDLNGNPLTVDVPRRRLGFDLRPSTKNRKERSDE